MKRKLILMILFMLVPFMVFADAIGPYIIGYEAVVVNKNGAKNIYASGEDGETLIVPYNAHLYIYNEYHLDAEPEALGYIMKDGKVTQESVTVKLVDIMPFKEEIKPGDINNELSLLSLTRKNSNIIVFKTDGIKLRKGPSEQWKEYDEVIDYMTVLKTTYVMNGNSLKGAAGNKWFYVDDGIYQGWINTDNIAYQLDSKIYVFADATIKDEDGKVIITIPAKTFIDEAYYLREQNKFYVKYNAEQGFVDDDFKYGERLEDAYIMTNKKSTITSLDGKVSTPVPFGAIIEVVYGKMEQGFFDFSDTDGYFYVKYNNQEGYIKSDDIVTSSEGHFDSMYKDDKNDFSITLVNDVSLYEYYPGNKEITTISKGTKLSSPYCNIVPIFSENEIYFEEEEWCIVEYNGNYGRILVQKVRTGNTSRELVINNVSDDFESYFNQGQEEQNEEESNQNNSSNSQKTDDTLMYCIAVAGLLAIISVAMIIVFNKNKKQAQEPLKDEKKDIKEEKEVKKDKKNETKK